MLYIIFNVKIKNVHEYSEMVGNFNSKSDPNKTNQIFEIVLKSTLRKLDILIKYLCCFTNMSSYINC